MIVNPKPSGRFLMEHFHRAGSLPAVVREISDLLHLDCLTVSGKTQREHVQHTPCYDRNVIQPLDQPLLLSGALVVVRGNLAPSGTVLKVSAASKGLLEHTEPALVFESYQEMMGSINSPEFAVSSDSVLVMRNTGPRGVPGRPEWGAFPLSC